VVVDVGGLGAPDEIVEHRVHAGHASAIDLARRMI
jgi:hypothetical protein